MKTSSTIIVIVLLSLCYLARAQQISLNYQDTTSKGIINVSSKDISSMKSYSIEGWVRPSMSMDQTWPSSFLIDKSPSIFGVSSSKSGWGQINLAVDSYLSAFLKPWRMKEGFRVIFDSEKTIKELFSPKPLSEIMGRWFFLYTAYHADTNQIYLAVKDTYQSTYSEQWSQGNINRNPNQSGYFLFSIGTGAFGSPGSMNGYVSNAAFKYLPGNKYYRSASDIDKYINKSQPLSIGVKSKNTIPFIQQQQSINQFNAKISIIGADEYGISGYFKLPAFQPNTKDVLLFRVSTNQPATTQTTYIEGDTALYGYLEKGTKICFVTYSLGAKATILGVKMCFPEAIPGTEQFYFYQAYSRKLQRVFAYIKIGEKEYRQITQSIVHIDPNNAYIILGEDPLTTKATGQLDKITFTYGDSSYQEIELQVPKIAIPKTYVNATLVASDSSSLTPAKIFQPEDKYQFSIQQYAIHFWYRRDLLNPTPADLNAVRSNIQAIAGATQKNSFTNSGEEALSVTYRPQSSDQQSAYIFTTYNDKSASVSQALPLPQTQDQGEWHWIYFGYNNQTKEASYTVTLGDGTTSTKSISGVSHSTSGVLKAMFGGSGTTGGAPGEFFDLQFVYYDGCYVNTTAAVQTYFQAQVASPPSRQVIPGSYEYLSTATFSETAKPDSLVPFKVSNNSSMIADYSIQTWASWSHAAKKTDKGSVLLSSSLIKPDASYNIDKLGNVVLQVSVSTAGVVFTTYNYGQVSSQDSPALSQTIPLKDYTFDDQWCFYYFGYSRKTSSARGFVNCDTGFSGSVSFPNVFHIISNSIYFSVAQTPISDQWYGSMHKPTFVVGKDLQTDLTVNSDRPQKVSDCPSVFSQCGYVNEIAKICENKESLNLKEVKSVYVPNGQYITFYKKANFKGIYVSFVASVECLDTGLLSDPSVQWSKLEALFHERKVLFSNENGDKITLKKAKFEFLGKSSLRKKSQTHQKVMEDDEKQV